MDLSYLINGKGLLDKPAILIETYEILYVFIAREIFKKTSDGRFSGNIIRKGSQYNHTVELKRVPRKHDQGYNDVLDWTNNIRKVTIFSGHSVFSLE